MFVRFAHSSWNTSVACFARLQTTTKRCVLSNEIIPQAIYTRTAATAATTAPHTPYSQGHLGSHGQVPRPGPQPTWLWSTQTHIHSHTGNQMMSSLLSKLPPFPCFTLFFPRSTLRSFCFFCFLPTGCWSSFVRTDSLRLLLLFFCSCCANSRFGNRVGCGEEFVPKAREFRFWQMEIFLFCHWVQGYCAGTIILLRL